MIPIDIYKVEKNELLRPWENPEIEHKDKDEILKISETIRELEEETQDIYKLAKIGMVTTEMIIELYTKYTEQ